MNGMSKRIQLGRLLAMALIVLLGSIPARAEGVAVKTGDSIAFMGDSITERGLQPKGYVTLVIAGLAANGIKVEMIPAGVSGQKSHQMLKRLNHDVLSKKPTWMTLSCGVNDVWHGEKGVPLDEYKVNITQMVEQCQAVGIKVMILTATMIGEDAPNKHNKKLKGYNDFLRALAQEKNCLLADVNADMQSIIAQADENKKGKNGRVLTADGVHMNTAGNKMMALGVLKAFGMSEAQLEKAKNLWASQAKAQPRR